MASSIDETSRPWSHLPSELLQLISSKITNIVDYLHFRSVCPSWRSSSAAKPTSLPPQLPRLLLPHDPTSSTLSFFGLLHDKTSTFDFPETRNKIMCGSSFGWLALIDASDSSLSLWNPFTRSQIPLPPLSSIPYYQGPNVSRYWSNNQSDRIIDESESRIAFGSVRKGYPWKVSLSSSPSDAGCVVAVTLSCAAEFALCTIGAENWVVSSTGLPWPVEFFTFHDGVFYCFDDFTGCWAYDVRGNKKMSIPSPDNSSFSIDKFHVVRRDKDLLMVLCYNPVEEQSENERQEQRVRIFKLDITEEEVKWVEVMSMGDYAIFLSANHSSVVRAVDFPGCREGRVYFSDVRGSQIEDRQPGVHYIDVYDMKQNRYDLISCHGTGTIQGLRNSTWVAPSFR